MQNEKKVLKRYSLILDVIHYDEVFSYNYCDFMNHFDFNSEEKIEKKSPLAAIDIYTTQFLNEEDFDQFHRVLFSNDYRASQFFLLTGLDPKECSFNARIRYEANYNSSLNREDKVRFLDTVFGDNKYLVRFLENNITNIRAEYDLNSIMWFALEFHKWIINNEEFYNFAVERLKGIRRINRFIEKNTRLIDEINECKIDASVHGNNYSAPKLKNLKNYRSLRAAAMIMTEYEKTKTSEYYQEHRQR